MRLAGGGAAAVQGECPAAAVGVLDRLYPFDVEACTAGGQRYAVGQGYAGPGVADDLIAAVGASQGEDTFVQADGQPQGLVLKDRPGRGVMETDLRHRSPGGPGWRGPDASRRPGW